MSSHTLTKRISSDWRPPMPSELLEIMLLWTEINAPRWLFPSLLDRNEWDIVATKEDVYFTFLHLADGSLSEDDLAAWFTKHAVPL